MKDPSTWNTILKHVADLEAENKRLSNTQSLEDAIEDLKQALCCGGPNEIRDVASMLWKRWDEYKDLVINKENNNG